MTPEERARQIVAEEKETYEHCGITIHHAVHDEDDLKAAIATAIREAERDMQRRCAEVVRSKRELYQNALEYGMEPSCFEACDEIAAALAALEETS